jgi:hypothetical protein
MLLGISFTYSGMSLYHFSHGLQYLIIRFSNSSQIAQNLCCLFCLHCGRYIDTLVSTPQIHPWGPVRRVHKTLTLLRSALVLH